VSGCIHVSTPHKPCKWVGCLHKRLLLLVLAAPLLLLAAPPLPLAAPLLLLAAPLLLLAECTVATGLVAGQCMAVRRHASGCNASVVKL
jgi:hypothetical protein